jgi:catechol 2,3-dioxygenase-like lactoylglutathione lyase family enzyme
MIINHMNLVVPDVNSATAFFIKHFGFQAVASRVETLKILHGSGDFVLILSNLPRTTSYAYPKDFHIGFYQPDQQNVDLLFKKLQEDLKLDSEPRKIRDRYGFYFYAPGEILIEITCPLQQIHEA